MNHSRRPHWVNLSSDPARPTWPRSAAKTPHWQANDDATRTAVLAVAKGTLRFAVSCDHSSGLTARMVK